LGDFSFNKNLSSANNNFELRLEANERHSEKMKKFVLCLFAAFAAFTLATGAAAVTNNSGGIVGATENIVGGVAQGAENIVGGVARGAENIVGGNNHHSANDNKDGIHPIPRAHEGVARNEHARGNNVHNNAHNDRNPSTAVGFGIVEIATIGATMLGTAAIAGGKKRR
jgi:hypothetical protein